MKPAPEVPWDEIEWRVDGKVDNGGGVRVVCYLDAPTVAKYLTEWVGPFNWREIYEPAGKAGVMWCHLEVRHEGEWVRHTDIGTASNTEADKGLVSDAFKRVAMRKWGIGRNVFQIPTLRLPRGTFDTYDRRGETQARLTDASRAAIVKMLKAKGFTDAAAAVKVQGDDPEPEPNGPKPSPKTADDVAEAFGVADESTSKGFRNRINALSPTARADVRKAWKQAGLSSLDNLLIDDMEAVNRLITEAENADGVPAQPKKGSPATARQLNKLRRTLAAIGITEDTDAFAWAAGHIGHEVDEWADIDAGQAALLTERATEEVGEDVA